MFSQALKLLVVSFVVAGSANLLELHAQVKSPFPGSKKAWFIARVVRLKPFTVEYLDWWSHDEEPKLSRQDFGVSTNPQAVGERVDGFALGELIVGEHCYRLGLEECPDPAVPGKYVDSPDVGMRLPSPVAIHLRRLDGKTAKLYKRAGVLVTYRPREIGIVEKLVITRDGLISVGGMSGGTNRSMSMEELHSLEREFFRTGTNLVSNENPQTSEPMLETIFGELRYLTLDPRSNIGRSFTNRLDRLAQSMIEEAEYRITYRWEIPIKDWPYAEILPIAEASEPGYEFIRRNLERLSRLRPSPEFFEEAKERYGETSRYLYRSDGELYHFQFPTCTDRPTGSFACFLASRAGKRDRSGHFAAAYDEWPAAIAFNLREIPPEARIPKGRSWGKGKPIAKAEFLANRDFYLKLLKRGNDFRSGDSIFYGVSVMLWPPPGSPGHTN